MFKSTLKISLFATAFVLLFGANTGAQNPDVDTALWPVVRSPIKIDPTIEAKIDALLAQMTVEQKVGQMIQPEIKSISPDDAAKYHIGSVLNAGGSWPTGEVDGPLAAWLSLANLYYGASMDTGGDRLAIPIMWGTDAVHGHNNVQGATVFPHNIGLGAANNPSLMRDIGTITAREVAVTGIDWAFSPTVAVARDIRWGRSYESFSSDPQIVANLSTEYVLGLQGHPALDNFLSQQKIIGTAKHFIGDGGTAGGKDQGETTLSERALFELHGQGYVKTIGAGVQTVMASFNSWNGEKLHGHKYLLTDVLKDRMGFDGFVVGDWNGHGQVEGCSNSSCPQSIIAGVDMIMVPEDWKAFLGNTIKQVKSGEISQSRIDDAVRRILRVKFRAGMFEHGKPSDHVLAGRATLMGLDAHRAIARQAVRESLVLLKNDGILPIAKTQSILIAGKAANHPAYQNGGWTLTWQGRDQETKVINTPDMYKGHTTILDGFKAAGAQVRFDKDGRADAKDIPDVAVFVFGESPYAEFEGDLESLNFEADIADDIAAMRAMKARGVPVVAVYIGGRPRGVDAVIELADAFVAAWLPGSEGAGIADVLLKNEAEYDFTGRLPFDWPTTSAGGTSSPRYTLGYGLDYGHTTQAAK